MTVVKSPYNFVPAPKEDEVFYPDWADQVNQDIPFSDGESGEIEFTITAETPIFIRNGHSEADQEVFEKFKNKDLSQASEEEKRSYERYISFSNVNGKYFIPGTSIKGLIRNTVEIMSNGKLTQLNDHRHSVRQIMRTKGAIMNEEYALSNDDIKKSIKCGYLIKRKEKFYIHSCGQPLKIRYTDIDQEYNCDFQSQFGSKDKANIKSNFDNRTAAYKYKLLSGKSLYGKFEIHPLNEDDKQKAWISKFQPLQYARFSQNLPGIETFEGTIVLVGQASNYNISTARKGEYVFRGKKDEVLSSIRNHIEVSKQKIDDFKFVNRDGQGKNMELKDWSFWKSKIKEGIPVFFRTKEIQGKKEILDFGLPFMYKQPANYRVKDLLPKYSNKKDLAEVIFGKADKIGALKGRVFISNASCINEKPKALDEVVVTLSEPKSSFTPNYLKQEKGKKGKTHVYNTYNTGGRLRGFKKYPVKSKTIEHQGESKNMQSHFKPLAKGTKFKGKIRFHNLRPVEIGALLSAITLNQSKETFHNLGYAKPLGYGRIKISNLKVSLLRNNIKDYFKIFEIEMRARIGKPWVQRIEELLTLNTLQSKSVEDLLIYNNLDEYQEIKNKGLYLQPYSELGKKVRLENNVVKEVNQRSEEINKEKLEKEKYINRLKDDIEYNEKSYNYEKALSLLRKLNELEGVLDFDEKVNRLNKFKDEQEENEFINKIIEEQNLEELQKFAKENSYHRRIGEINSTINAIKPAEYPDRYKTINLKMLLKEVPRWLEKENISVSDFKQELTTDFKRAIKEELKKKNAIKKWGEFKSNHTWGRLTSIIGKEEAKKIFDDII